MLLKAKERGGVALSKQQVLPTSPRRQRWRMRGHRLPASPAWELRPFWDQSAEQAAAPLPSLPPWVLAAGWCLQGGPICLSSTNASISPLESRPTKVPICLRQRSLEFLPWASLILHLLPQTSEPRTTLPPLWQSKLWALTNKTTNSARGNFS